MKMWNEKGHFDYEGCVQVSTTINYGNNDSVHVTDENYTALRSIFIGRVVEVGTSFSNPEIDSMGD